MARQESIALGGFYACPPHLIPRVARLLESGEKSHHVFLDPCAGEGEAVRLFASSLMGDEAKHRARFFCVELEARRFAALKEGLKGHHWPEEGLVHGDAFRVVWEVGNKSGATAMWLNPPYDTDRVHGRLEQAFLERYAGALRDGGALVFVVPHYALRASAKLLARAFDSLACFRFPGADFAAYRQVFLLARKRPALFEPDAGIVAQVERWSANASSIPELPEAGSPVFTIDRAYEGNLGFATFRLADLDLRGLALAARPWQQTDRRGSLIAVPGTLPEGAVTDLLERRYPVAMPPRPAHIAAAIAAGVFNGARLEPDDPKSGLPPVLVKGVFDKDWRRVEEKTDKDGKVTAVVEIQQPRLVVTALDLRSHAYCPIASGAEPSGATTLDRMNAADLIAHYGRALMGALRAHCPVLHDPGRESDRFPLQPVARPLYQAQAEAVRASVRLLGGPGVSLRRRQGKAALVLGEIGSGKSSVALSTAKEIGARSVLVVCPPHLLQGWTDQTAAVLPEARVSVLSDVEDVQSFAADRSPGMRVAVLSRETAKLGHAFEGVTGRCPRCGGDLPKDVDLAKTRARCERQALSPLGPVAEVAMELGRAWSLIWPAAPTVQQLAPGRLFRARRAAVRKSETDADRGTRWQRWLWSDGLDLAVRQLLAALPEEKDEARRRKLVEAILLLCLAAPEAAPVAWAAEAIFVFALTAGSYGSWGEGEHLARELLLLLPREEADRLEALLRTAEKTAKAMTRFGSHGYDDGSAWRAWAEKRDEVAGLDVRPAHPNDGHAWRWRSWKRGEKGAIVRGEAVVGERASALVALGQLATLGHFTRAEACGEPLYQAIPEPRRVPLAHYLCKHHPKLFDLLVLDEVQEFSSEAAAQTRAAHRLTALGLPTLLLTGSVMNGYAESLFSNFWAISPEFRAEFGRDERQRFIDRYGYRKRLVQDKETDTGKIVAFGSVTDRVERKERIVGDAPGVLPLFVLRHLLRYAVTLHKADLAIDLPPCREERADVSAEGALLRQYKKLETALLKQIKKDRYQPGLAGALWGQLVDLPSYLDRATADVGNGAESAYEIRYPENTPGVGGHLVASVPLLPADTLLPKEAWLLETVERELAEGRRVLVFGWHVALLPRLARLISDRIGEAVPVLSSDKVPTAKRQAWIDTQVIGKNRRVLVVNPVCVQTGLNNLVYFATEVYHQNPACNPLVYRQAVGRVDRIGQALSTRILFPVYQGTAQEQAYKLLMTKVSVSLSTDGLDGEAALEAAGAGDGTLFTGLSVGKQLFEMLTRDREAA